MNDKQALEVMAQVKESFETMTALATGTKENFGKIKGRVDQLEAQLNLQSVLGAGRGGGQNITEEQAEHHSGFLAFARKGIDAGLTNLEITAGLTTQSDPDGGYLVSTQIESELDKVALASSAMRRLARIKPVSTSEYKKFCGQNGASSGWVGEEDTRSETDTATLKELIFPTCEIFAFPYTTQNLLDDASFDVESWLTESVSDEMTGKEGSAFINGNGVKKPRGLLNYETIANASYVWGKLGYIASGAAATLTNTDKIIDLVHSLKVKYRQGASFLMNSVTVSVIRKLKNGDGEYIWQPGMTAGQPSLLLGYPVEEDDNMPDIGAGLYPVAFGDFKRGYVITDRQGVRVLRDPYTIKGKVGFYTTKRIGGGVQNFEAIKLMKIAA